MTAYTSIFNTPPSGSNYLIGDTVTLTGGDVWKYAGNGQWLPPRVGLITAKDTAATGSGSAVSISAIGLTQDGKQFGPCGIRLDKGLSITLAGADTVTVVWAPL